MHTKHIFTSILCLLLTVWSTVAQRHNELSVPDVTVAPGQQVMLSVNLDNTDDIVGVQFYLQLPDGISCYNTGELSERASHHQLTLQNMNGNRELVVIYSPENAVIAGRSGNLLSLPLYAADTLTEGRILPIELTSVVMAALDGTDLSTAHSTTSNVNVALTPDITVTNLTIQPGAYNPGDLLMVEYDVENISSIALADGWRERIALVKDDTEVTLGNDNIELEDGGLPGGVSLHRQQQLTLPQVIGLDGKVQILVELFPYSTSGEGLSGRDNNAVRSKQTIELSKQIFLTPSRIEVTEGQDTYTNLLLYRSGNVETDEIFTVTLTDDSRLSAPSNVTIASGQSAAYIHVNISANHEIDTDSVAICQVSGNGYEEANARIVLKDDTQPSLSIFTQETTFTEGDAILLTIGLERPCSYDLDVVLTSNRSSRISMPSHIVVPAQHSSADVTVQVLQDDEPQLEESVTFAASAAGYNAAQFDITLTDDDMPNLELTLTPNIVSEGDGPLSVTAMLRRTDNIDKRATIRLTDNSNGDIYYQQSEIVMLPGTESVNVKLGPVDNQLAEGTREWIIEASVFISSCSCNATGKSGGMVTAPITIYDNDGPALTLTTDRTTILEGDERGAIITLSRNDDISNAMTVQLKSNVTDVSLPASVTIPAGQRSVEFALTAPSNNTQEGNRLVTLTAEANGYSCGTTWLLISDQTLPDMEVTLLTLSNDTVLTGDEYEVMLTIANFGAASIPARSVVQVNAAGSNLVLTIPQSIAPGETVQTAATFTAPMIPGAYDIVATANSNNAFTELQTNNNTSFTRLVVASPYTYQLITDRETYGSGAIVKLSGSVRTIDGPAALTAVEPYIIIYNERIALSATTDAEGKFNLEYPLTPGVAGDFIAGVDMPGEESYEAFTSFSVYGLARTETTTLKNYVYVGDEFVSEVPIRNLTNRPVHNVKATIRDDSGIYQTSVTPISLIEGNSEAIVKLSMNATEASPTSSWDRLHVILESDEGATVSFTVYNYAVTRHAQLALGSKSINTTVTKGTSRTIPVIITNTGVAASGKIKVDIPGNQKFISLATPNEMPSLNMGDSITMMITFNPEGLDVNVTQTGELAVNCDNADGIVIAYAVKVVSEDKGSLLVRVQDENTIYGNAAGEHPYVSGAMVNVKDYNTGVVIVSAITDEEGTVTFNDLNEGYYTLYVTADKHDSYTQNVLVNPGVQTEHLATVSYRAISISSTFEETSIEDVYEIKTELTYETQVPVPVVILSAPDEIDLNSVEQGHDLLFNIMATNVGLITAENVVATLPSAEGFKFIPLAEYEGFELAPQESHIIPVLVTVDKEYNGSAQAPHLAKASVKCHDEVFMDWEWVCKDQKHAWISDIVRYLLRTCDLDDPVDQKSTSPTNDPEGGPTGDPLQWYPGSIHTQADLYGAYQFVSALSCSLACFLSSPEDWLRGDFYDIDILCILNEMTSSHAPSLHGKAQNNRSLLYTKYYNEMMLLYNIQHNGWLYYQELMNAPQLGEDEETFTMLTPYIDDVNHMLEVHHQSGTLYDQTEAQLHDAAIVLMPQRRADWYDFNLDTYLERQVNTWRLRDGQTIESQNFSRLDSLNVMQQREVEYQQQLQEMGFIDTDELIESINETIEAINEASSNTCATVKIEISQELHLNRQAFRGTIEIDNGSAEKLSQISATVTASLPNGVLATSHEMQIELESVEGFTPEGENWSLEVGQKGKFTFLFIPTQYAAPTVPVTYTFGGFITFDDGNDLQRRDLYPVPLVVNPSPVLDLTYFMQRDVYGDNPLTLDVVEPVVPAEFSVLIHNKGYGDANNVHMVTHQPRIVENEKGLDVEFAIVSSSVNGEPAVLALQDDIATDFGTIAAGSSAYATWGLTSTLMGHFKEYDVSYTHITDHNNPDLSLLDQVNIHELIHSVNARVGDKTYRAWVTNDLIDLHDDPDQLYLSNGTNEPVHALREVTSIENLGQSTCRITVNVPTREWYYTKVDNPYGRFSKITKIVNETTMQELDPANFWTTDYLMRDGRDPVKDYKIHLVDTAPAPGLISYLVSFEPVPDKVLEVERIDGLPATADDGLTIKSQVKDVFVSFNKPIDSSTFDADDMMLRNRGILLDMSLAEIQSISDSEFAINLSALTKKDGLYVFTVNTQDVTDFEGFCGNEGKCIMWIQYGTEDVTMIKPDGDITHIVIYAADGTCVMSGKDAGSIDLSQLPHGIYIIRVATTLGTSSHKVQLR